MEKAPVTLPLKDYAAKHNFIQYSPGVRMNENEYPFITFYTKDNKAENIYFSRSAAEGVALGEAVKPMLKGLFVVHTTNAAGEPRVKLATSQRESLEDAW